MYVCVCRAITDREIRAAVRDGVATFGELQARLGVASCCGRCEPRARALLQEARAEPLPPMPVRVKLPRGFGP